ncbi:MAG: DUF4336 domain-containing protein [Allosphingosinicella sp.]|uniref:DUF4336 domain-containing protein n=1 Tax=Allosphingosinicella sp. TaxID=2823234 RepID=UPI0039223591
MREAHAPYAPLWVPKTLADGVWTVDGPEIRMNMLGLRVPFPTRMTIVRLRGRDLWVHSPIAPRTELYSAVERLGRVACLVAPNSLHHAYAGPWQDRFPEARLFAVPDLVRKTKVSGAEILGSDPPPEWADDFDQLLVAGDAIEEAVFFHRASRTLILTDLIENFEAQRVRVRPLRWALKLAGATHPDGKAPLDLRLSFLRHRRALRAAARRMLEWAPERVVMAHGRIYQADGAAELARAFRWVLAPRPGRRTSSRRERG